MPSRTCDLQRQRGYACVHFMHGQENHTKTLVLRALVTKLQLRVNSNCIESKIKVIRVPVSRHGWDTEWAQQAQAQDVPSNKLP